MATNEHRWPVPVAPLTDGSVGTVVWQHRGQVHLTVAVKATYAIPRTGDLQLPVRSAMLPVEAPDRPNEVVPLLTHAEVHLSTKRDVTSHLAIYRGQERLLNKSGAPSAFAPIAADDPRRQAAMNAITGSVMLMIPEGFSWDAMHAAPEDQRLDRLTGIEWVMVGATGDTEATRVRLPGMVVSLKTYGRASLPPIPAPALDMLHVDLDMMRCSLVWRTHLPIPGASTMLNVDAIAAAVHSPDKPFEFPESLPKERISKACRLPDGVTKRASVQIPAVKIAEKMDPLNATMGSAVARSGPALPFAGVAQPGGPAVGTVDVENALREADLDALRSTMGAIPSGAASPLPFAGQAPPAKAAAPVGSAGAPWEQPAKPVRQAQPATSVTDEDGHPSTAVVHRADVLSSLDENLQTAEAVPASSTLDEMDTRSAPVIPPDQAATPFTSPNSTHPVRRDKGRASGPPWMAQGAAPAPNDSRPSHSGPPPSAPAPAYPTAPQPPAPPPSVPGHAQAYPAPGPARADVAPPAVVPGPVSVARPAGGTLGQPTARERAAAAAALEQREREYQVERDARLRAHQAELKRVREEIEAAAAEEEAAQAAEAKRQRDEERAEAQRKREMADRDEAEKLKERQALQKAKRERATQMQDALYGFRTK